MPLTRRKLLQMATLGASGSFFPNLVQAREKPIVIGEINSYVDTLDDINIPYRRGLLLATEQVNDNGGIHGRPLKVISKNDRGREEDALHLAEHLVKEEKVSLLCGSVFSNIALGLGRKAQELEIPYIVGLAMSDSLTLEEGNAYTYRLNSSTYMQTHTLALEAAKLPVNRWVCVAPDYEYGYSAVANFKQFLSKKRPDVEFQDDLFMPLFGANADLLENRLKNTSFEAVFNATFAKDLKAFVDVGQNKGGFDGKLVTSMLAGQPENLKYLNSHICEGWLVSGYPWQQIVLSSHVKFIEAYQRRFDEDPNMPALIGYILIGAIQALFKKAPDTQPATLLSALRHFYFDSPLGTLQIRDLDHQVNLGSFVGRLTFNDKKNEMVNWFYADGSDHWPPVKEVINRRPDRG
ncbi:MAG: ABC transporter substrate-binding protein [Methylocystaceae bacterium]|nr:ABC transporter substrate-binding protein [Methylocystaceae bacterium]